MIGTSNSLFWMNPPIPVVVGVDKWYIPVDRGVLGNTAMSKDGSDYVSELFDVIGGGTALEQSTGSAQPQWISGNGLAHDGVDDCLVSADTYFDFTSSFTACVWVKFDVLNAIEPMFSKWLGSSNQRGFLMQKDASNKASFSMSHNGQSPYTTVTSSASLTTGTWYFLSFVYDSVGQEMKVSVDGGAFDTVSHTTGVHDSTEDFKLCFAPSGTYLDGKTGSIYIKKAVMSLSDINKLKDYGVLGNFS